MSASETESTADDDVTARFAGFVDTSLSGALTTQRYCVPSSESATDAMASVAVVAPEMPPPFDRSDHPLPAFDCQRYVRAPSMPPLACTLKPAPWPA